jgi:hypothetical protein
MANVRVNVVGKVIYVFVYPLSPSPAHTASLSAAQATCSNLAQQLEYSSNLPHLRERRRPNTRVMSDRLSTGYLK